MDAFGLSWAFDKRWLCGINLHTNLLTLWAALDLCCLTALQIAKHRGGCDRDSFIENSILLTLLAAGHMMIVIWVGIASGCKSNSFSENK